METIGRRIQFYQVEWAKGDKHIRKDLGFLNSILGKISLIETKDEQHAIYIENYKNDLLSENNEDKSFWRMSKIRSTDYPLIFNKTNKKRSGLDLTLSRLFKIHRIRYFRERFSWKRTEPQYTTGRNHSLQRDK